MPGACQANESVSSNRKTTITILYLKQERIDEMSMNAEEKKLEEALKRYNEQYAQKHPEWAEEQAAKARMFDEDVAAEAVRAIWTTLRFEPYEQANEISSDEYFFGWRILDDNAFIMDVRDKLLQDEDAAKRMLSEDIQIFCYGGPSNYEEAQDIFVSNLMKSRFVHFQITKKSDGGFDAFAVFRIPESSRAVIIRLCK
jgi:hypothetical protein